MYIKRGMTEYADKTLERLRTDIKALELIKVQELEDKVEVQPETPPPPQTQIFGTEERIECYYCQLEPAEYKNLSDPQNPYLCDGCWRVTFQKDEGYTPL